MRFRAQVHASFLLKFVLVVAIVSDRCRFFSGAAGQR